MPRDTRTDRDMHALDENGMVLCNPRDKEAAHRAEMEGIATYDDSAVTCEKCLGLLYAKFRRIRNIGQLSPGDGVDRLSAAGTEVTGRKPDHASERLASQIFDALCLSTLLSEIGLGNFAFTAVSPTGKSGRFLVNVCCVEPEVQFDPTEVEATLQAKKGMFRAEVSQAVNRRKAPELQFRVLPPGSFRRCHHLATVRTIPPACR
jgi:hypothetical protein